MAAKSVLIAVGITAAALGHWTPFLLVCVILSLAPQLIVFRDEFHYSAWLADLWAQCALLWRRLRWRNRGNIGGPKGRNRLNRWYIASHRTVRPAVASNGAVLRLYRTVRFAPSVHR